MNKLLESLKKQKKYWDLGKSISRLETNLLVHEYKKDALASISRYITSDKLVTTTMFNKYTLERANQALNNHFFLMNNLDMIEFRDGIDWNYQHHVSSNTYQLYLHCLNVVSLLCDAFQETKDKVYVLKAYEILLDWANYDKTNERYNAYQWIDHSAANRTLNIIYFYHIAESTIDINEQIVKNLLVKHGNFLMDDANYTENNHGIMVDRSLIILSVFMKDYPKSNEWFNKAILRLKNAFYRDFSFKGVHLENSPAYHTMTSGIYAKIATFLQNYHLTLGKDINFKLEKTNDYLKYIYKPNKTLPIIGDSQEGSLNKLDKTFHSFHDPQAGITILQNKASVAEHSTWLSFVCGYSSKTHKHYDDLSISLFYNGADVLVDSGRYNYDKTNKIRQYLVSPSAHSTIAVKGEPYPIGSPSRNMDKIKTTSFLSNPVFDLVKGVNHAYKGISISRVVILLKPNIVILVDQVKSKKAQTFQQIFNLAPNVTVNEIDASGAIAHTGKDAMKIKQFYPVDRGMTISADKEVPQAIISKRFGEITETNQFVFEKEATKAVFLTVITLGSGVNDLEDIHFNEESHSLFIKRKHESLKIHV